MCTFVHTHVHTCLYSLSLSPQFLLDSADCCAISPPGLGVHRVSYQRRQTLSQQQISEQIMLCVYMYMCTCTCV